MRYLFRLQKYTIPALYAYVLNGPQVRDGTVLQEYLANTSEEELYHVRDLVRCAQKKMSLIAEEGGAVLAGTERGEA